MGEVQRWNVIFMLPVGENVEHIKNLMCLDNIAEYYVQGGTYIFHSQLENIGLVVKDEPKAIVKFFPLKQYIIVLRHPSRSFLEDNFDKKKQNIASYYIKSPHGWNMCFKFRKVRCPAVIEPLISHFYQVDWR